MIYIGKKKIIKMGIYRMTILFYSVKSQSSLSVSWKKNMNINKEWKQYEMCRMESMTCHKKSNKRKYMKHLLFH